MPTNPGQEFVVAVAGPAVNVLIAAGLFVVIQLTAGLSLPGEIDVTAGSFMARLLSVNVALVLFNLIPAFPMDGGRILRSLIALKLEYARATSIAASLGQAVALVFGFIGFFGNPFLILIAVFVWMGAAQESNMAQMQAIFRNVPVRDAMLREYHVLAPEDTLARAVELVLATSQQDFPVVGEGRVLGIVTWNRLQPALTEHGEEATVDVAMTTEFETAEENDSLEEAVPRLQQADCKTMPVLRDGAMVGIVTMGNIGELMAVRSARRTRG
jgi:predicted transcriptional regulator